MEVLFVPMPTFPKIAALALSDINKLDVWLSLVPIAIFPKTVKLLFTIPPDDIFR